MGIKEFEERRKIRFEELRQEVEIAEQVLEVFQEALVALNVFPDESKNVEYYKNYYNQLRTITGNAFDSWSEMADELTRLHQTLKRLKLFRD